MIKLRSHLMTLLHHSLYKAQPRLPGLHSFCIIFWKYISWFSLSSSSNWAVGHYMCRIYGSSTEVHNMMTDSLALDLSHCLWKVRSETLFLAVVADTDVLTARTKGLAQALDRNKVNASGLFGGSESRLLCWPLSVLADLNDHSSHQARV